MDFTEKRLSGAVIRKTVAQGSKSEREAVILRTPAGEEYVLRRPGGSTFRDSDLDKLVGSSITADGVLGGQTFVIKSWKPAVEE